MEQSFFEVVFPEIQFNLTGDTQVCCPFPHKLNGHDYFETRPSAGINISKGIFHCFSCNRGYSEIGFTAEYLHIPYEYAIEIVKLIHQSEDLHNWEYATTELWKNETAMQTVLSLGFNPGKVKALKIGYKGTGLVFPIIMFGRLLDEITYRPGQVPKYKHKEGTTTGLIYGYDLWKNSSINTTIICAGEKDATCAISHGLNAISFTGGEQTIPHLFLNEFKNKAIYIVYDNDETGQTGSAKLAIHLQPIASEVHLVDLSSVCTEKGQDLWDFFNIYHKTTQEFLEILKQTPIFTAEDQKREKNIIYPIVSLHEATTGVYTNRILRSNIQVVATFDTIFSLPTIISGYKYDTTSDEKQNLLPKGHKVTWALNDRNLKDMFNLIDSGLKENNIDSFIKTNLLKFPPKEACVTIKKEFKKSVYKSVVTDLSDISVSTPLTEFVSYSIDSKLEAGKRYLITYKLVPHPQDGQKLMMVVNDVEDADDFIESFTITKDVIESLKKFQPQPNEKLQDKFNDTLQRVKGLVNADYNDTLLTIIDLFFHSALEINVGHLANTRGYLDMLIIGESRIGKSSTVEALQKVYGVGKIISLAGNSATVAGLMGGSNKVAGSYQTRAGIIPQNHKGAIIFEELAECNSNIIKELTDWRSSGKVRINRVNGSIELNAMVRSLSLTNPKQALNSQPKPISSYPNGISVLLDIIGSAQDIARYDLIAIFGFDATKPIDPFFEPTSPYPTEDYRNRIHWIWSRKPNQIVITKSIYEYVTKKANFLNATYNSHIKIFGIEAWKKIIRLATAIAGYLCSTDETYENLIVKHNHIDLAIEIMVSLYDNPTFRFRQFVEEETKLREIDVKGVTILQQLYETNSTLLNELENCSESTRANLLMASGLDNDAFGKFIHALVTNLFIVIKGFSIVPTERFRKGMQKITKTVRIPKAGEVVIHLD